MKKSLKILTVLLLVVAMVFTLSTYCFAASATDVINGIEADDSNIEISGMTDMAGRVLGFFQVISAILTVVLIAYLGFKMILGSAGEKADVQKQFIPLIIGCVIVFAATSIAQLLLGIMGQ